MSKITAFFLISAALLVSCKKEKANTTTATTLSIKVTDGRTGNPAAGAIVSLFTNYSPAIVSYKTPIVTDANGSATITVDTGISKLYFIVQKDTDWNFYNGLIPVGVFSSATDIANSPVQDPAGVIGGVKFKDTNGDGKIDASDDVLPPMVAITANTTNTINTTIY